MPREIGRREAQTMMELGVALVDVLPVEDYEEEHIPGAINIPLRRLDREAPQRLSKDQPVVVYCFDGA
jgi:rhodanese-related sulfurtransferase